MHLPASFDAWMKRPVSIIRRPMEAVSLNCTVPLARRAVLEDFRQRYSVALGHLNRAGCGSLPVVDHPVPAAVEVYVGRACPDTAASAQVYSIDNSCKLRPAVLTLGSSRYIR